MHEHAKHATDDGNDDEKEHFENVHLDTIAVIYNLFLMRAKF